jgi:hypothetical protein
MPSSFPSAFWFGTKNSFRGLLLVHSNDMAGPFQHIHFYKGYNTHVLKQSVQFITVPNSPFIVISDWAIHGPQNFSLKDGQDFLSDENNTHVSDAHVRTGLINVLYNMILIFHVSTCDFKWFCSCINCSYFASRSGHQLPLLRIIVFPLFLQAGRSRGRFPMRSLDFSIGPILPAILWPLGRLSL